MLAPQDVLTGRPGSAAVAFTQANATLKGVLHPRKIVSVVLENDSLQESWLLSIPSALFLEPQTPDSSHATLGFSALPPLELRVSGCKRNFVHWPFKIVPVSPVASDSPWQTETPLLFTARCYVVASFWLWCSGMRSLAWG